MFLQIRLQNQYHLNNGQGQHRNNRLQTENLCRQNDIFQQHLLPFQNRSKCQDCCFVRFRLCMDF